ncbi:MAG: hypothetical protein QXH55_04270 [Candidatus Korarchaeota archaeon]|nr:hypothetical protein [Thermoproteota archaeon]MCR8463412.1 hypothetical protein [Thermoproteota archaeon]MCR8470249.1 hypothetical protein [Thermoproteota archaeon]MCR8472186.1 hypothetical protein [Thermoproteota archaeon]MCR8472988.1 hypothetical protein [Thermoproteota archaeon]
MLHVIIYIVDALSVDSALQIENALKELKSNHPYEILSFRVIPGKGEITILVRENTREVIDRIKNESDRILERLNLKIQQRIYRTANCQYNDTKILALMLILEALINGALYNPSEITSRGTFKLIRSLFEKDTNFRMAAFKIKKIGLSKEEFLTAMTLYMMGRSDVRSIVKLCSWTLNIDSEGVIKHLRSLESRGLLEIQGKDTVSLLPVFNTEMDEILSILKDSFRNFHKIAEGVNFDEVLKEKNDESIYILDQGSIKKLRLSKVTDAITLNPEASSLREVLPLILYLLTESRGKVISKRLFENIVSLLAELIK